MATRSAAARRSVPVERREVLARPAERCHTHTYRSSGLRALDEQFRTRRWWVAAFRSAAFRGTRPDPPLGSGILGPDCPVQVLLRLIHDHDHDHGYRIRRLADRWEFRRPDDTPIPVTPAALTGNTESLIEMHTRARLQIDHTTPDPGLGGRPARPGPLPRRPAAPPDPHGGVSVRRNAPDCSDGQGFDAAECGGCGGDRCRIVPTVVYQATVADRGRVTAASRNPRAAYGFRGGRDDRTGDERVPAARRVRGAAPRAAAAVPRLGRHHS